MTQSESIGVSFKPLYGVWGGREPYGWCFLKGICVAGTREEAEKQRDTFCREMAEMKAKYGRDDGPRKYEVIEFDHQKEPVVCTEKPTVPQLRALQLVLEQREIYLPAGIQRGPSVQKNTRESIYKNGWTMWNFDANGIEQNYKTRLTNAGAALLIKYKDMLRNDETI
jgi:hypothetical protein